MLFPDIFMWGFKGTYWILPMTPNSLLLRFPIFHTFYSENLSQINKIQNRHIFSVILHKDSDPADPKTGICLRKKAWCYFTPSPNQ